jgi:hypothetical protein
MIAKLALVWIVGLVWWNIAYQAWGLSVFVCSVTRWFFKCFPTRKTVSILLYFNGHIFVSIADNYVIVYVRQIFMSFI